MYHKGEYCCCEQVSQPLVAHFSFGYPKILRKAVNHERDPFVSWCGVARRQCISMKKIIGEASERRRRRRVNRIKCQKERTHSTTLTRWRRRRKRRLRTGKNGHHSREDSPFEFRAQSSFPGERRIFRRDTRARLISMPLHVTPKYAYVHTYEQCTPTPTYYIRYPPTHT